MLQSFQEKLGRLCPDWRRRRFVVAYSGGLDSSALLNLMALSVSGDQLAAAHLNHQIRAEAEADQSFAARNCAALGLTFIHDTADVPALAENRRRGLEEAARFARYEFFKKAARSWAADFVLTAHQADDQAETILMHLIKGGGGGGLAGIPPRRPLDAAADRPGPELLRPLLTFHRNQLRLWLEERKTGWVEDASNQDASYLRNAVRLEIMPKLQELNPRFLEAVGRTALILRDEEDFWKRRLACLWADIADENISSGGIGLNRKLLAALTTAEKRRLIYEAFLKVRRTRSGFPEPPTLAGVETVLAMLDEARHRGLDLPGGLRAALNSDALIITLASRLGKGEQENENF